MTIDQTRTYLAPVLSDLASLFEQIGDDQRSRPTPCAAYNVGQLSGHVVGWLENFAAGFADESGTCPKSDVTDVEVSPAEAPHRVRTAAATLDEAVGAGAAERPLVIQQQGGLPGEIALSMMLGEYIVHGWDLSRATGLSWSPDAAAVTAAHTFLEGMITPEYRGPEGMFDTEVPVPDEAPALDRLLGFAGRDPQWQSPS